MSLQLIVFPQSYNGMNSFTGAGTECVVDGIDFNTVNASSTAINLSGTQPDNYIDVTSFTVNTWYRFSYTSDSVSESSGAIDIDGGEGILQQLSNLTVGAVYDCVLNINSVTGVFRMLQYSGGGTPVSSNMITTSGVVTINFTAASTDDIIALKIAQ